MQQIKDTQNQAKFYEKELHLSQKAQQQQQREKKQEREKEREREEKERAREKEIILLRKQQNLLSDNLRKKADLEEDLKTKIHTLEQEILTLRKLPTTTIITTRTNTTDEQHPRKSVLSPSEPLPGGVVGMGGGEGETGEVEKGKNCSPSHQRRPRVHSTPPVVVHHQHCILARQQSGVGGGCKRGMGGGGRRGYGGGAGGGPSPSQVFAGSSSLFSSGNSLVRGGGGGVRRAPSPALSVGKPYQKTPSPSLTHSLSASSSSPSSSSSSSSSSSTFSVTLRRSQEKEFGGAGGVGVGGDGGIVWHREATALYKSMQQKLFSPPSLNSSSPLPSTSPSLVVRGGLGVARGEGRRTPSPCLSFTETSRGGEGGGGGRESPSTNLYRHRRAVSVMNTGNQVKNG